MDRRPYPFTGQQVGRVAAIAPAKADAVLRQTHAAKSDLSRYDRARILNEMATAIESRRDEVARLITAESGLCLKDTTYEASRVCDVLRFAAIKALDDDSAVSPATSPKTAVAAASIPPASPCTSSPRSPPSTTR